MPLDFLVFYEVSDDNARPLCVQRLPFEKQVLKTNKSFDKEYLELPCPSCGFSHLFKRVK